MTISFDKQTETRKPNVFDGIVPVKSSSRSLVPTPQPSSRIHYGGRGGQGGPGYGGRGGHGYGGTADINVTTNTKIRNIINFDQQALADATVAGAHIRAMGEVEAAEILGRYEYLGDVDKWCMRESVLGK
jgi:hypothetical protein